MHALWETRPASKRTAAATLPGPSHACFSQEKRNSSDTFAAKGCCQDFTSPCQVPVTPNNARVRWYGPGGLSWPYGGVGTFISVGLMEAVAMGQGVEGWKRCTLEFGHGNTDCQVSYRALSSTQILLARDSSDGIY